ncbi:MAG: acyltransferase [Candidatus Aureabacteria bacterium]|nr:acyltransferase [Candidatus Auribacterota bacterium]
MPDSTTGSTLAALSRPREGALAKYMKLAVGKRGFWSLLNYELRVLLFENMPGAPGIILRRIFYRGLFKSMGRNIILGKGLTVRNPGAITLGDNVAIDDYCTLDARGADCGISIGDSVVISRGTILRAKNGRITISRNSGIGSYCILASSSTLDTGEHLLMASCVCVLAGGEHAFDRLDVPIIEQGMQPGAGVAIGADVWIGTRATILDSVRIGDHAVIGACALVNNEIPAYAVAYGIPAKPVKDRRVQ